MAAACALFAPAFAPAWATAPTVPTREAALQLLAAPEPEHRIAAIEKLAEVGTMADGERLVGALRDASEPVRTAAGQALWAVWNRSGDEATDQKMAEGVRALAAGDLDVALARFDEIVHAQPAFAEGWNKRATVLFLLGREGESLRDCDEAVKRNRLHFGALAGMAQIYLKRGDVEQALAAYERALEVNPNLVHGPQVLQMLREAVRERQAAAGVLRA
ncbi:MAG: tetratricopeptide repeat protein [Rubrivivax sp.]|nr:tetratricopeptide repeat protein [Rubrivivax sp.]